ncbi:MAG: retropepsin-like domain-containing protein [Parvularculaceae bacterium]|nr:retropepsin-like domain-containing protein [Parvularculaceae bacterium]
MMIAQMTAASAIIFLALAPAGASAAPDCAPYYNEKTEAFLGSNDVTAIECLLVGDERLADKRRSLSNLEYAYLVTFDHIMRGRFNSSIDASRDFLKRVDDRPDVLIRSIFLALVLQGRSKTALAMAALADDSSSNPAIAEAVDDVLRNSDAKEAMTVHGDASVSARVRTSRSGTRYFRGAIGGRPARIALDTAAMHSIISASNAKAMKLIQFPEATIRVRGLYTSHPGHLAIAPSVAIGGMEIRNAPFLVLQDDAAETFGHILEDGVVLGLPFLAAVKTVEWDFKRSLVVLGAASAACTAKDMTYSNRGLTLRVTRKGAEMPIVLDTGAEVDSWLFRTPLQFYAKDVAPKSERKFRAVNPDMSTTQFGVDRFEFEFGDATISIRNVKTVPIDDNDTEGDRLREIGYLGFPDFSQARALSLDFESMKYRACPRAEQRAEPF